MDAGVYAEYARQLRRDILDTIRRKQAIRLDDYQLCVCFLRAPLALAKAHGAQAVPAMMLIFDQMRDGLPTSATETAVSFLKDLPFESDALRALSEQDELRGLIDSEQDFQDTISAIAQALASPDPLIVTTAENWLKASRREEVS